MVAEVDEAPLSPNGAAAHPAPRPARVEAPAPEPRVTAEDRTAGGAVEALKASRLDFLFRSKATRPVPQPEQSEADWTDDGRPRADVDTQPQPRADQTARQADAAPSVPRRAEPAAAPEPRTAAILKSGVVDGMAYTLYADGSIEAKLPQGTVRFGSIAELRTHIESNS